MLSPTDAIYLHCHVFTAEMEYQDEGEGSGALPPGKVYNHELAKGLQAFRHSDI